MLTLLTQPENLNNAAMKTRAGGKAGYASSSLYYFLNLIFILARISS